MTFSLSLQTIAQEIISKCTEEKLTIATAESITGGQVASMLTSVSGSSAVFFGGVVAYSEHSKIHSAGVDVRLLQKKGVYCEEVVMQMAERIARRNIADIGLATSGCAEEGDEKCPKGQVYFALSRRNAGTKTWVEIFSGTRNEIQEQASVFILEKVLEELY